MKYKALDILRTFTEGELQNFRLFLNSKYLNKSTKVTKLFESLLAHYPEFNAADLNEVNLSKEVSPHLQYNRSSMKNLFADLAEAIDSYLTLEELFKMTFERNDLLRSAYHRKNLWKYYKKNVEKPGIEGDLLSDSISVLFLNKYKTCTDKINSHYMNSPKSSDRYMKTFADFLDERSYVLAGLFTIEMIRMFESLEVAKRTFAFEEDRSTTMKIFELIDFEELTAALKDSSASQALSECFGLYNAMLKCFIEFDNEKNYFRYKELIRQSLKKLSGEEIRFHLIRLVRYCMTKNENVKSAGKFERELFDVYKYILDEKYYKVRKVDFMPTEYYRTVVLQSLKLREIEFTRKFIADHKRELHPARRENMHLFSTAYCEFYEGNFKEALNYSQKVKLDYFMLKCDIKNLMLMIYFELGLENNAKALIDSYRHFISKDSGLSGSEQKKHKDFISAVSKLFIIRNARNKYAEFELKEILNENFPCREWVQEKWREMTPPRKKHKRKT